MRNSLVLLIMVLSCSSFAGTDEESRDRLKYLYGESEIYENFFYELKNALITKEIEKVANLNGYPIRVNFDSGTKYFKNKNEFITNYESIVTSEMLERVKQQSFANLFANSYGMHIGLGDIWFTGYCIGKDPANPCEKVKVNVTAYNVNHVKK
ncbi:hypothetical protein [Pseudoalteromonas sp. GB56]